MQTARQRTPQPATPYARWLLAVFCLGLLISATMVARSQVTIDQYNLLARGWRLAFQGEWVAHGVRATGGGNHPGGVTSLAVGLPLLVWQDHRAPALFILMTHILAFGLLHSVLRRALGPGELVLFAVVYWLSPWRLFYSGFVWNPNFLFVCGALHLSTAHRLRHAPRWGSSFAHVLLLGIAVQLHVSALLLIVSSLLLWWRRYLRLHIGASLAAGALVCLSLLPWLLAMVAEPHRMPASQSSVGHGLLTVAPILQGVGHWLRYSAIGLNRSMACLDFTGLGGPGAEPLGGLLFALRYGLAVPTLLLAGWANWRLWRRRRGLWRACRAADSERRWLEGVLRWSFLAALVVFALSPVGVSGYGVLSLFHLAVLPVVFAVGSLAIGRRTKPVLAGIGAYATVLAALGVGLALATPAYRCGGPICATAHFTVPILEAEHPMLDDLGIRRSCEVVVDETNGWWPDGLELVSKSRRTNRDSQPAVAAGEKPAVSSAGTGS